MSEKSGANEAQPQETALAPKVLRVVVVTSDVPFVEGGHRVIANEITRALERQGHRAELVKTPQNRFGRQFFRLRRQSVHRRR